MTQSLLAELDLRYVCSQEMLTVVHLQSLPLVGEMQWGHCSCTWLTVHFPYWEITPSQQCECKLRIRIQIKPLAFPTYRCGLTGACRWQRVWVWIRPQPPEEKSLARETSSVAALVLEAPKATHARPSIFKVKPL